MRAIALVAIVGAGMTLGGVAAAEPWTDPAGRVSFETPSGWRVQPQIATGQTVVLAFNAGNDCYFFGLSNPLTTTATARSARNSTMPLTPEAWASIGAPIRDFFPDGAAQLVSQSVDTSHFWPSQRAELGGGSRPVFGAVALRPGFEMRALCSGSSSAAAYESIFASLGHPNDSRWQAEAEQQEAERAAAAAAAAAPPEEEQSGRRRRNN